MPMFRILTEKLKRGRWLQGLLVCAVLQAAAVHGVTIDLAKTAAVHAIAYDDVANRLYFADETGALKRLDLTPQCEATPPCQVSTVATGLGAPADIEVNSAAGLAYVINSDGILWKVDLNANTPVTPVQIARGLGVADLVLAPEINAAFGCETRGDIWRGDLSTGTKTVLAHLPNNLHALTVNAARTFAYVSTGNALGSGIINEVDLTTGKVTRTFGFARFASVGSLAWTDSSEHALYALVFNTGNVDLVRVDLVTSETTQVAHFNSILSGGRQIITPVLSLAVNPSGSGLYLGGYNSVLRFPLSLSPAPGDKTVFLSIGNIPSTSISPAGLANTASIPGAVFKVSDSPFGGTLDIFGNLTALKNIYGADRYQILVQKPGPFVPIQASWTAYHWNQSPPLPHYEPRLVAPIDSVGTYMIPPEYGSPATAPFWSP